MNTDKHRWGRRELREFALIQFARIRAIRVTIPFGQLWSCKVRLSAMTLAGVALVSLLAPAQPVSFGKGTNVKYRDFYDPPNQSQVRAFVQGSEAVPEGRTRVRLKNLHIESFRENGEAEAVVDAPDCVYDHELRTASSDGPIKAQTTDGRMRIEGTGFSLSLTNKSLTISNNVRTVIRDLGTNPKKP